jgi:outer membrane protein OmpA-like peptidoglycan-associated protein
MTVSLEDALSSLIVEATPPLAKSLGEAAQATERGLCAGVAFLIDALQARVAEPGFFDRVLESVDDYSRTNADGGATTYFSSDSTTIGDRLIDDVLGADRTKVTTAIALAARMHSPAASYVLNVASVLVLRSLEPAASCEKADGAPSQSERSDEELRGAHLPPLDRKEAHRAKVINGTAHNTARGRSSKFPWLLLAAAIIVVAGTTWRFSRAAHLVGSKTALAPAHQPPLAVRSDAAAKAAQEATSAQVREKAVSLQEEATQSRLNEVPIKLLESRPATPEQETPLSTTRETRSPEVIEAESIMQPAPNKDNSGGDVVKKRSPNGVALSIPKSGVEYKLLAFLERGSSVTGEFDLDRVAFNAAKARLRSSSRRQLQYLAEILKTHPNASITIKGYTGNNLGDKAYNLRLSQERADRVLEELARMGVNKSRMTAQGFGGDHTLASNDGDEGRSPKRRISFSVSKE